VLAGFKKFMMRGNVVDLAVAVVLGAAFTKIVGALVDDVIMPLITAIVGKPDYSELNFKIHNSVFGFGNLIAAVVNFVCVAAAVYFLIVVPLNAMADRRRALTGQGAKQPDPTERELLAEIRDLLRANAR
jgi:large conductance mechanosensitive channel